MNKLDASIANKILTNSINIFRLTSGERKKAILLLTRMHNDLIAKLARVNLTVINKDRAKKLLDATDSVIAGYYSEISFGLDKTLTDLSSHVAEKATSAMVNVGITASLPTQAVLKSLVSDRLIQGAPSKAWWSRQATGVMEQFSDQIRQGIAENNTVDQMLDRISPIIQTSERGARALVHTSVQTVQNDALMATYQANDEVLKGVQQLSTFDSHTSDICIAYSGASYDLQGNPINGTTLPMGSIPRHWNCRSVWVPLTKSWRELGVDIDEIKPGTRASDEGQISATTTMSQFLKGKSPGELDELLGKGKAELFSSGKITLRDLLDQNGRPLTLQELKGL